MLGSRTKQINAYGKRSRRVIDAGAEITPSALSTEIVSIFDDLPPAPEWKSVASKMKKRENAVPPKFNGASVKVVGLQKKKRLSPVLSPQKKKLTTRVGQLIEAEAGRPKMKPKPLKLTSGNAADPIVISASPVRAPLSAVSVNILGSPAISHKSRPVTKSNAGKAKKPFSPFVDVDIIVLDDEGRTLRTERRVSRTDIEANPFNQRLDATKTKRTTKKPVRLAEDTDSDCEIVSQPRRPRRKVARKPIMYQMILSPKKIPQPSQWRHLSLKLKLARLYQNPLLLRNCALAQALYSRSWYLQHLTKFPI
jgi:serine/threonine-protein kinase haspin